MGYFFLQAEDGIRDLVRSRGLGDVYKRQIPDRAAVAVAGGEAEHAVAGHHAVAPRPVVDEALSLIHI